MNCDRKLSKKVFFSLVYIPKTGKDGVLVFKIIRSPRLGGGPVVKSGPTFGKVRSRNKNGRWRAKRSDASR